MLATMIATAVLTAAAPAPAAVTSYSPAYFARANPTSALDMVTLLPGFSFDRGGGVRGFGGGAGNVLIDGARPASKDDGLDDALKRIPASSVAHIDLIAGGAPGIDMQGKSIIANVVLRTDRGGKLLLAASGTRSYYGRLQGVGRVEGSLQKGPTSYEGSLLVGNFFDNGAGSGPRTRRAADGSLILQGHEDQHGVATNGKATGSVETPVLGGKLRLNASLSTSPYYLTTDTELATPRGREFELYTQGQDTAEVGLRYARPIGPSLTSETFILQQLSRAFNSDNFATGPTVSAVTGDDLSDVFLLRKTLGESIVRTKIVYQARPNLAFEAGGEGDYNWLTARTSFLENGAAVALPAANVHVTEERGEAFATGTWTATPKITLEFGLRMEASRIGSTGDVVSQRDFVYAKPRAAGTWSPDAADQFRLRVEREVGQLNFDDFVAVSGNISTGDVRAGNPQLTPQADWVVEGAYERKFWGGGDATVTLRHYAYSDVIDRVPEFDTSGDEFDAPGNIGSGRENEVAFALTLPTDRFGLKNGLLTGLTTFRTSHVIDPTTGLPRPISQLHSNDWEAHFTQTFPRYKTRWGFDAFAQSPQTSYRYNEIDTDNYKTYLGLFAEYKPRSDLIFRFELKDANAQSIEHARLVYAGARNNTAPAFADVQALHVGRFVYFRITKTFG